jgi:hypothetical protein
MVVPFQLLVEQLTWLVNLAVLATPEVVKIKMS